MLLFLERYCSRKHLSLLEMVEQLIAVEVGGCGLLTAICIVFKWYFEGKKENRDGEFFVFLF